MNQNWKRMLAALGASAVLTLGAAALDGGTVRVNSALNVRSAPTTASAVRGKLQAGRSVTLYERSGNWWRIGYAGGSGYVYAAYIEEQHLAVRYVRTGDGSVRRWERALLWGAVGVLLAGGVLRNLPAFAFLAPH